MYIIAQVLGYLAFIFLAVSLWVNNDLKFRWINSLGCIAFIFYGVILEAFPIVLTNSVLLVINIYFLIKIYRRNENIELVEFNKEDMLVAKFLKFYENDIKSYFPKFTNNQSGNQIRFIVLRDMVIANIFVVEINAQGDAIVQINYTVPKYRDYKVGRFLFDEGKSFLQQKGIHKIVYEEMVNTSHSKFLQVMGFKVDQDGKKGHYFKQL